MNDPVYLSALERIESLIEEARRSGAFAEPTAMTLCTVDAEGLPNARVVLLKGLDARGFVFFTNHDSVKGRELAARPFAALCFYWGAMHQQVRVRGRVEAVSEEESDAYFATRPRGSQLGAWASFQSQVLDDMATLEARLEEVEALHEGVEIPRPPNWGGLRVVPSRIEFWEGRSHRLHVRRAVEPDERGVWRSQGLYP